MYTGHRGARARENLPSDSVAGSAPSKGGTWIRLAQAMDERFRSRSARRDAKHCQGRPRHRAMDSNVRCASGISFESMAHCTSSRAHIELRQIPHRGRRLLRPAHDIALGPIRGSALGLAPGGREDTHQPCFSWMACRAARTWSVGRG